MADAAERGPVQVVRLREDAVVPRRMSAGAAGMDVSASMDAPVVLEPGQRAAIPTGLALAIPPGFEGQVRPRSGLALRQGITVANAPGTIDADYRGELKVILINLGRETVTIEPGERIAQLVFAEVATLDVAEVEALDDTERGAAGFGSTGRGGGA